MTTPPDFRIDQLDPIGTLDGTELLYFVQGGSSLRGTLDEVAAFSASVGKQTIWMPASAMTPNTTNGAASGTAEMSSNKNMVVTLDFDQSTQEFAQFSIAMPKSWDNGTITFFPVWSHVAPSSPDTTGVAWGLDAVAVSDGDALDVAFGTAGVVTDTGASANTQYIGAESSAVTISGTPATGDVVYFRIHRDPANGSDNLTAEARLHGVKIIYTTSAGTDD